MHRNKDANRTRQQQRRHGRVQLFQLLLELPQDGQLVRVQWGGQGRRVGRDDLGLRLAQCGAGQAASEPALAGQHLPDEGPHLPVSDERAVHQGGAGRGPDRAQECQPGWFRIFIIRFLNYLMFMRKA